MKNIFSILMMAAVLLVAQACGSKKSSEAKAEASIEKKEAALTADERKTKFENQRAERAEKRRIAYEKLCMSTPTYTDASGHLVYNKAEREPSYVGGKGAMMSYLKDNMKYPQVALDKQDEALVFVDFVIGKNGIVREVEVTEETNENVDVSFRSEAARVVASMPKWSPGLQNGKPVDVKFSLPVSFQIL